MESDDIPMADDSSFLDQNQLILVTPPLQNKFSIDVLSGKTDGEAKQQTTTPDPEHSECFECDEQLVLERLQDLYPYVDIQKLPRQWSLCDNRVVTSERCLPFLDLSTDFLRVTKKGSKVAESSHKDAAAVRANRPIPKSTIVYYFEIKVISRGAEGRMGLGLSEKNFNPSRLPGWEQVSYGYHGDDGHYFENSGKGVDYGPTFTTGDIIGCGLNFVTRDLFFTKNGKRIGVAGTNIPIVNDLYPTMGMQSNGEMVDVNFGQIAFCYNIKDEFKIAEAKVSGSIMSMELPFEKTIWMNRIVTNWLTHEGYSRVLECFQKANGVHLNVNPPIIRNENGFADSMVSQQSQSTTSASARSTKKGSLSSMRNSESGNSSAAVEAAAAVVAESIVADAMGNATGKPSVVQSVQQFIHEKMDERRAIVRLMKKGHCGAAIEKIDQVYPNLFESNRQLALLLKIQHFVEMIEKTAKDTLNKSDVPSTSKTCRDVVDEHADNLRNSNNTHCLNGQNGVSISNEHCTDSPPETVHNGTCNYQNGNSLSTFDEIMEDGDSNSLPPLTSLSATANGNTLTQNFSLTTNGLTISPSVDTVTAPFTTTTIIEEEDEEDLTNYTTDRIDLDFEDDQMDHHHEFGGFSNNEERAQIERYMQLITFAQSISQFAIDHCDGQLCSGLRQRMNNAFSLICYQDPWLSDHSYLMSQKERDFVAKSLNFAILENFYGDGTSPLDKIIRQAKSIREQATVHSASSLLTKLFGDEMVEGQTSSIVYSKTQKCQQNSILSETYDQLTGFPRSNSSLYPGRKKSA